MRQGLTEWVFSVQLLEVCEGDCCMRGSCARSPSEEMVPELRGKAEGMHSSDSSGEGGTQFILLDTLARKGS